MKKITLSLLFVALSWVSAWSQNNDQIALNDSNSWSMIVLPDPQTYSKFNQNQPIFDLMLQWIKNNKDRLNTELVLCTGDLVEQNNISQPDGKNGNQTSGQQWQFISRAFQTLDDTVPYILCTGNHDHGVRRAENRDSQFNSFFPANRKSQYARLLKGMIPNASGVNTLENAWYEYTSPHGEKFLIVSLEFNARKAAVEAAKELVNRPVYRDYKVIYLTHSYMNSKGTRIEKEGYQIKDVTCGKQLWEQLIATAAHPSLVVCGHVVDEMSHRGHVGFRADKNNAGKTVNQMMFNAQAEGGGWHGNGGDGWLRILEFMPDKKTVNVRTFSPLFAISPATANLAQRSEPYDEFSFIIE